MLGVQDAHLDRAEGTGVKKRGEQDDALTHAKIFCSGEGLDGSMHFLAGVRMHNNFVADDHAVRSTYSWTELKTAAFVC